MTGVKAKEIAVGLGLKTTSAEVEGVRLEGQAPGGARVVVQETSGVFGDGRRPVAGPGLVPVG
ncbi:hypothetical protein SSP24_26800 [Streptomyces spinoverrucosus]|uniref:Uncharacterized protein n=1 Tax=Streptomyces spinoverrucosus TaxID=284043 RepID=A0A4Y3VFL9_9ACTN|nr:hypothetical protein [Streptomyces spinoverrucosus]GEC05025.1 hypothetical protein SSP24_26800 [Streptomyces spinoverrucosus]GHB96650.1 hypothetical protein GCM10010397_81610 [Streptomyces spinoverrucosus]